MKKYRRTMRGHEFDEDQAAPDKNGKPQCPACGAPRELQRLLNATFLDLRCKNLSSIWRRRIGEDWRCSASLRSSARAAKAVSKY